MQSFIDVNPAQSGFSAKDVAIIAPILDQIEQRDGAIRTETLVAEARAETHPLHAFFEWNDADAAHQHRLDQARRLVRAVRVNYVTADDSVLSSPAYVSVRVKDGGEDDADARSRAYRSVEKVMADPEQRDQIIQRALRDIAYWRTKYQRFAELQPVFDALERVSAEAAA